MSYSSRVHDILQRAGAAEGDTLLVRSEGRDSTGVLMPHHDFSHPDVVVLKLKSGYNVGVMVTPTSEVRVVSKSEVREKRPKAAVNGKGKKEVAVLGTGGTIASFVDYRTGAVHPALSAGDLVATVPEIADVCDVRAEVLFSIFSENMNVEHWQRIAEAAADRINSGMEGCIVPHGTDTMGYTSAALSFMLDNLTRSVVLVGAQRSSDRPSSDAYTNLLSAARFVVDTDAAEVVVLMHETSSDTAAAVHRGTKVRKMHTSRRDAFHSINVSPIARLDFEGSIEFLSSYRRRSEGKVTARTEMETNVALLYFYPGMSPAAFERVLNDSRGVVFAGTGLGHVSSDMVKAIRRAVDGGTSVVMTSQCLNGMVDLNVYDNGRDLVTAGVMPGGDMLPETAYVKLMWVLGQTSDPKKVREMMATDLRGELTGRREVA
ncbi:MAG: Glu-tRNA(Gln) amidotransferase subunit GatD [Methanomassiliicoccus sp.]|nr:Glu-tRNA(Gln) amidotransferase subunit GatD [Methanomassiliicoccus sp.]